MIRPLLKKYATFFISKKLHLDYVPTEKKVVTDSKWLGVIVEQVLSNAVKYTPEEGTIRILFDGDTLTIEADKGAFVVLSSTAKIPDNNMAS